MRNIIEVLDFYIVHLFKFQNWRRYALFLKWGSIRPLLICRQFFLSKSREIEFYLRARWSICDANLYIFLTRVLLVHSKCLFNFYLTKDLWYQGRFRIIPLQVDLPPNHCFLYFEYLRHQFCLWLWAIWSLFHLAIFSDLFLIGATAIINYELIRVVSAHLAAAS